MEEIEGRDIFAADFNREEQNFIESKFPSEIQKFFENSNIFITGGSGFLGKILLEKLLSVYYTETKWNKALKRLPTVVKLQNPHFCFKCQPEVYNYFYRVCGKLNRIYFLMRPKKGKSIEERYKEIFDEPIFEGLTKINPNFKNKITIIPGDLAEEDAILEKKDRELLVQNVNVIFHCAATVRFDEKLRRAVNINIKATKFFLDMASEMKNLKAYVHVSTAYSNCPQREIGEQFYPPPYNYKKITDLLNVLDDGVLDKVTNVLIDKWPNTYAFTKLIAEDVVREYGKGLPIGIIRPSIVINTYKEPISGWVNNYYGPQGVILAAGLGLLRTLYCDANIIANMVPVDLVINAVIAFAWDLGQTRCDNPNFEKLSWKEAFDSNANFEKSEPVEEIPVLNYVSSERNPITWGHLMFLSYREIEKNYSTHQIWHSSITLNSNLHVNRAYQVVCHLFPAAIVDSLAFLTRRKPMLWNGYKKIHRFSKVLSYFSTIHWKFRDDNVVKLWNKLSPKDRKLFNFDIEDIDWDVYSEYYIKGLRVYLLKDPLSTYPEGKKRAFRLKIYHYTLVTVISSLLLLLLYWLFCRIFL